MDVIDFELNLDRIRQKQTNNDNDNERSSYIVVKRMVCKSNCFGNQKNTKNFILTIKSFGLLNRCSGYKSMLRLRTSAMKTLLRLRKCYSAHSSASLAIKTLFWKPKLFFNSQIREKIRESTTKSYFDHENTAPTIKTMQLRKIIGVDKTIKRQWPWSYLRYSEAVYSTSIIATVFMEIFHELIFLLKNFPNESSYFYIYPTYTIQKKMSICRHTVFCSNIREIHSFC